ncbi:MAG TPA: transcription antitermination factor NusB [Pseudomonadota bacterium]|nr:transcription antitermination factor NusB [Pseudomonadota bacterium]
MGSRRRARAIALQILCAMERQPDLTVDQAIGLYFRHLAPGTTPGGDEAEDDGDALDDAADAAAPLTPGTEGADSRRFSEDLVRGVKGAAGELDELLTRCSRNWRLERMSWVDRNLLRLASYELSRRSDTPARVAINEAIEVAKRYGTTESPAFINGVLDRVLGEIGRSA